jgi:16S rRNA (cytidine1402-2'-O)-methyltransferase
MLYVISTPIGNLSDITLRAIETLKKCDYILCEDTRHSLPLLQYYSINKPLKSFHKYSESAKQTDIITDLQQGSIIALISDAGTPGISDPGSKLIQTCLDSNICVTSVPGACAAITALSISGLDTQRFQFLGFLPRKTGELQRALQEILSYPGTTICYESPNRLLETLECLNEIAPKRYLAVARELTKKFEELRRGVAIDLITHWTSNPLKGEIVLMISGNPSDLSEDWNVFTPQQHVEWMQNAYKLTRQEAIIAVAKIRAVSKRDIYNAVHQEKQS